MKKIVILSIIIVLGAGGYLVFEYQKKVRNIDVWTLVPENAVVVYESHSTVATFNDIINSKVWKNLQEILFFQKLKTNFELLDSLSGKSGNIDKLLINQPFLASMHITSRNEWDYLFYFKLRDDNAYEVFNTVVDQLRNNEEISYSQRRFLNIQIQELKNNNSTFSYILYEDHFIGSFTPFLIEDAIRNIDNKGDKGFIKQNPEFKNATKIQHDEGNLYVNMNRMQNLFNAFTNNKVNVSEQVSNFCKSAFFDLTVNETEVMLNGVCFDPEEQQYFSDVLQRQIPASIDMDYLLPKSTAIFYHYNYSDAIFWQNNLVKYWQMHNQSQLQKRDDFFTKYDINIESFNWLAGEVAYAIMETIKVKNPDKIIYLKAKDINKAFNHLTRLAEKVNVTVNDTLYTEEYGSHIFKQLRVEEFPSILLGELHNGFETTFFTAIDDYLVLGNNIAVLKSLVDDIEAEEVWSKSIRHNTFTEKLMDQSNLSLIIDTEKAWNLYFDKLDESWKFFFKTNNRPLKNFNMMAMQMANLDQRLFANIILQYQTTDITEDKPQQFIVEQEVFTDSPIITKPYVVRNHIDRSLEVFLQDSAKSIYLISGKGEILWKRTLQEKITSDVFQVDYYKNGKLQYLFATDKAIHIFDRNGDFVANFPTRLDSITIDNLSLIDYDNSKRYRFLVADPQGNLYMFNQEPELLEGWAPLETGAPLAYSPGHLRVVGKDFIYALLKSGIFRLYNRRGESYPGFPVKLKTEISSPIYIETGPSFEKTVFTAIDKNGLITKFNLNGNTINTQQLYKPNKDTGFNLVGDALGNTYIIVRQDFNRLSMLDKNGELIFEKDYITSKELSTQYYYFGIDNEIFAVTDHQQEFTYVYDQDGELINFQPIESNSEIGLIYSEMNKSYKVYNCFQNRFSVLSFARN
ncbi:MAG: hypothetical protein ACOCXH_11000 [Cyclobacteriaceae bacterium]